MKETTLDKLKVGDKFCIETDWTPKPNSGVGAYEIIKIVDDIEIRKFYYECKKIGRDISEDAPNVIFPIPHPSLRDIENLKHYVLHIN